MHYNASIMNINISQNLKIMHPNSHSYTDLSVEIVLEKSRKMILTNPSFKLHRYCKQRIKDIGYHIADSPIMNLL